MRRIRLPHPLTLLVACVLLAAALSYVVPAGQYDRRDDPATGRKVVVAGSYHRVARHPIGVFETFVNIPKGMTDAASVIFYVFLVGGAFAVVDRTGALRRVVDGLASADALVIPVACIVFWLGGTLIQMQEELIAFVPVLLLLTCRLGYSALTAVAMSIGAAAVGAAFSPINPFQVGIAQKVAALPILSGWAYRTAVALPALAVWIWATMRHAARTRSAAGAPPGAGLVETAGRRQTAVLCLVLGTFALFVYGVLHLGWDFDQLAALFFILGLLAGMIGGLGLAGTADALVEGYRSMAFAALLIGFARAIYIVLDQGHIVDTVVYALATPLAHLPVALSAVGMMAVHILVHVPVPSTSGQAVLTLPVLVPVSDLIGLSRQVTVLAYQYGAGLCELLTPTNGALMAMLVAAGVRYEEWCRFAVPVVAGLALLGIGAIVLAIAGGV